MSLKTKLDFENEQTKELLSKLDFGFFLKQHFTEETYSEEEIKEIYIAFEKTTRVLKQKSKTNRKQFQFYLEGQVRKMFTGGFIPAMFHLDEGRSHRFIDFFGVGESWAYFKQWADGYKKKLTRKKIWDIITKAGSLLAIILSVIKLWETFSKK